MISIILIVLLLLSLYIFNIISFLQLLWTCFLLWILVSVLKRTHNIRLERTQNEKIQRMQMNFFNNSLPKNNINLKKIK